MAHRLWKRAFIVLLIGLTACNLLPKPPTPTPVIVVTPTTPTPAPTPIPPVTVTFNVHLPANTPAQSAPAIRVLDAISGQTTLVTLLPASDNLWTGAVSTELGAVLRYRYVRGLAPNEISEATPAKKIVQYRMLLINGATVTAEDVVAAWADTPFAGNVGAVTGIIRNTNTGRGVMGLLVGAGGQLTLTHWDGSYTLTGLPVGFHRVTVLARDGSMRPTQNTVNIASGQTTTLDLATTDPNAVHVTFLVRPPADTDPTAQIRLLGNVAQLGDTFVVGPTGSTLSAVRAPQLIRLNDGTWTANVLLYEGTHLKYAYTVADTDRNVELEANGARNLRSLVVPLSNKLVSDSIARWHDGLSGRIAFGVVTPPTTPPGDVIYLQISNGQWGPPIPMWRVEAYAWKMVLYNPTDLSGNLSYRFCRNASCGVADDAAMPGNDVIGHFFSQSPFNQDLTGDQVANWHWLIPHTPYVVATPTITTPVPNFSAGIDLAETWKPEWQPYLLQTLKAMPANNNANWVTVARRGLAQQINPTPIYSEDPALAPSFADWNELVMQAHTAGMRVALHPVTCDYTPYGECDYWKTAPYSLEFWNAWFAAYERYLLTQADIAARSNTDLLVIGDFKLRPALPGEPEAPAEAEARWRALIGNVRARYRGQIAFELLMGQGVWPNWPPFLDAVDVIRLFWWTPISTVANPSRTELANTAGVWMDVHLVPLYQRFQKPIHLSAAYYAADGAATQCLKDTQSQCLPYTAFNADSANAAAQYALDLAEQADIYTGLLTALQTRPWISGFSAYGYNPVVTLEDKSLSVRGKPAEAVLKIWYPRFMRK